MLIIRTNMKYETEGERERERERESRHRARILLQTQYFPLVVFRLNFEYGSFVATKIQSKFSSLIPTRDRQESVAGRRRRQARHCYQHLYFELVLRYVRSFVRESLAPRGAAGFRAARFRRSAAPVSSARQSGRRRRAHSRARCLSSSSTSPFSSRPCVPSNGKWCSGATRQPSRAGPSRIEPSRADTRRQQGAILSSLSLLLAQ